ncbi:MAG: hypothetical protein MJ222_01970 [Bacilli bacterium]|nr:hypothetical protein [Bacilli bacterium]
MRIAKIRNKYMYNTTKDDKGSHHYIIFYDNKNKRYNAVQLTHLYTKDKDRFIKVKKGLIKIEKFKEFEVPSGVKKEIYFKNSFGGKIDINNRRYVDKVYDRFLSKKQSDEIKEFIYK